MGQIETLERELRDLARTIVVAARRGWEAEWMNRYDQFKIEVRQTLATNPNLKAEMGLKILPGKEILNEVLRGMKREVREDRRRKEKWAHIH